MSPYSELLEHSDAKMTDAEQFNFDMSRVMFPLEVKLFPDAVETELSERAL